MQQEQAALIDDGAARYGLGRHGAHEIRRQLARGNPMAVIKEFQASNALAVPNADKVVRFLDLLAIKRAYAYQTIMQKLLQRLLDSRIGKSSDEQKQKLLETSFRYIDIQELREVPVRLLSDLPEIPANYLGALAAQPALLEQLPLCIVRQVWSHHPQLFHSKLVSLLGEFVGDAAHVGVYGSLVPPKVPPAERRHADPILQTLVQWVGSSSLLYDFAVRTIRDQFASTHQHGYCILRMELLMALHDQGQQKLVAKDPAHMFAWCLDASVRERELEGRLLDELRTRYTQLKQRDKAREREREHVGGGSDKDNNDDDDDDDDMEKERALRVLLQDLGMVVAHPLVTAVLLRSISSTLDKVIVNETVPKDSDGLRLLSHVLLLGCSSRRLLRPKRHTKLPKSPAIVLRSFYPLLCIERMLSVSSPRRSGISSTTTTTSSSSSSSSASDSNTQRDAVHRRLQQLFVQDRVGVCRAVFAMEVHQRLRLHNFDAALPVLRILGTLEGSNYWEPAPLSVLDALALSLRNLVVTDDVFRAAVVHHAVGETLLEHCLVPLARRSRVYCRHLLEMVLSLCSSSSAAVAAVDAVPTMLPAARALHIVRMCYADAQHRPLLPHSDHAAALGDLRLQRDLSASFEKLTALPGDLGHAFAALRQRTDAPQTMLLSTEEEAAANGDQHHAHAAAPHTAAADDDDVEDEDEDEEVDEDEDDDNERGGAASRDAPSTPDLGEEMQVDDDATDPDDNDDDSAKTQSP